MRLVRGWKKDEFSTPFAIFQVGSPILDTKSLATYIYLVSRLEMDGKAIPSFSDIAKACCFSVKTAERAIERLEKVGLIKRIHRWKGPKQKDSNLYIIYHPEQIGLNIKDNKNRGTDNLTVGSGQNDDRGTDNLTDNICQSVGLSVSQSNDPSDQIKLYWKKAFNENIDELALEEILSFDLSIDKVKEIIRKVALYIDIKTNPFAVVIRAVAAAAQGKEWQWNENSRKVSKKQWKKKRDDTGEKLPKAIQKQDEEYGCEEVPSEVELEKYYRELRKRESKQKKSSPKQIQNRLKKLRLQLREEQDKAMPNYSIISSLENEIKELERKLEKVAIQETGAC